MNFARGAIMSLSRPVLFGPKFPNQFPDRLAHFPGSDVAVARDEHGKVNFGCDDHAGARPSVSSGVPEAAAGVSGARAACPTGCADKPSGTVSYGGCGITSCQEIYPTHYPPLGISRAG